MDSILLEYQNPSMKQFLSNEDFETNLILYIYIYTVYIKYASSRKLGKDINE